MIAEETGCCGQFSKIFSAPITLVGGQAYAIRLLYREAGGGDYGQVAVKLTSDPTNPDILPPINGSMLAGLADPSGASINITQQPVDTTFVGGSGVAFVSQDFNANNGGFTVTTPQTYPAPGPWQYSAGSGSWQESGSGPETGHPNTSFLDSPGLTVTVAGQVVLSFNHRWSREQDSVNWDGNQVRLSVNGGAFTVVPGGSFSSNSYNGSVGGGSSSALSGQQAFVGTSPGFVLITSVANLGTFQVGDVVIVRFMAASDGNSTGPNLPGWEIDSMSLSQGGSQNATFSVVATAVNVSGSNPPRFYQWYRDNGTGFNLIPGANSATYSLIPTSADNGARFRVVISIPGATVTSAIATLTVPLAAPTVLVQRLPNGDLVLTWAGPNCLQEAGVLTTTGTGWGPSAVVKDVPFTPTGTQKYFRLVNCP